jgi:hypothetical protein
MLSEFFQARKCPFSRSTGPTPKSEAAPLLMSSLHHLRKGGYLQNFTSVDKTSARCSILVLFRNSGLIPVRTTNILSSIYHNFYSQCLFPSLCHKQLLCFGIRKYILGCSLLSGAALNLTTRRRRTDVWGCTLLNGAAWNLCPSNVIGSPVLHEVLKRSRTGTLTGSEGNGRGRCDKRRPHWWSCLLVGRNTSCDGENIRRRRGSGSDTGRW